MLLYLEAHESYQKIYFLFFTTIGHAFICYCIDYCNSLFTGLPKSCLSFLQSLMSSAARLIARLPLYSHISTCMTDVLHWFPVTSHIQYKVLDMRGNQSLAGKGYIG